MYLFYYSISVFLFCFIRCLSFCFRDAKIRIISELAKRGAGSCGNCEGGRVGSDRFPSGTHITIP